MLTNWHLAEVLRIARVAGWVADFQSATIRWLPGSGHLLGVTDEELSSSPRVYIDRVAPDDRERVASAWRQSMTRGESFDETFQMLEPANTWLRARGEQASGPDGVDAFVGFVQDVTDETLAARQLLLNRDAAEDELRHTEDRYRAIFSSSPLPKWLHDPTTMRFVDVNESASRVYGYSHDEFLSMRVTDLLPPDVDTTMRSTNGAVRPSRTAYRVIDGAARHRKKNGTVIDVEVASHPTWVGSRSVVLVVAHEVTDQRRLEAQLLEAQKMEAVGRMTGAIAHDFNNVLAVILATADCALARLDTASSAHADVREIGRAARRGAELTRQLLTFSRRQVVQSRVRGLDAILRDMEPMLRRVLGDDITLTVRASNTSTLAADRMQVEQLLMNLVVNARDAMAAGGTLDILAETVDLDAEGVARLGLSPGPFVNLRVSDTGCGMDEATRRHIFEPFFTTKEIGKGTGLGLSTVYDVVRQCGGAIEVESEVGIGTSFSVWFPWVEHSPQVSDRPAQEAQRTHENATILIVEDEDQLRSVICRILRDVGFTVLEASDGLGAIRRAERLVKPVDLLVTDVVMPGMDGRSLVAQMRVRWPDMSVLFMSGYDELSSPRGPVVVRDDEAFLRKPFSMDQMRSAIDAALHGSGALKT